MRKEAPQQAPHIVAALKQDAAMMKDDPEVRAATDDAVKALNDGASGQNLDQCAHRMSRAFDSVENKSGTKAAINDPALSPAARGYGNDAALHVRREMFDRLMNEKGKNLSPQRREQFWQNVEAWRLRDNSVTPRPPENTPSTSKPAPDQPALKTPPPNPPARTHKAAMSSMHYKGLAALPRDLADAAIEANRAREVAAVERDAAIERNDEAARERDAIKADNNRKTADLDGFFASPGTETPFHAASPSLDSNPLKKAATDSKTPKVAPVRLASNEHQPVTAKGDQVLDKGKKPEPDKKTDPAPVRTAAAAKSNLSQPKPA